MSTITASLVKELREKTGAGMMDCKKALIETNADFDAAIDWLRKKGHASVSKRSDRVASEGLVALAVKGKKGVAVELNSETDFVARNEKFQNLLNNIVNSAFENDSLDSLKSSIYPGSNKTTEDEIIENAAIIGEKLSLRRVDSISVENGVVGSYVHNTLTNNTGKIAVLVGLESDADQEKLKTLAKQISMHIAAAAPEVLNISDVEEIKLEREKEIFREQSKASGKPDNIIEKMIEGRIKKYYQEIVLLEQTFIMDNKTIIKDLLSAFGKENNTSVSISGFIRYALGEGLTE